MKQRRQEDFTISTDKTRLDVEAIHGFLSRSSYWAQGRPPEQVRTSIENSLCFGVYDGPDQVGFARVVTDYATFAWVCEGFVLESHRGRGLGKRLVEAVVTHPAIRDLRRVLLATRDAHGLYKEYGGFPAIERADRWMTRRAGKSPADCPR